MKKKIPFSLSLILAAIVCSCDDGGDDNEEEDAGPDTETETESETDDCADIAWGTEFKIGEPTANWEMSGYADSDGDGVVEQVETAFTLGDIRCTGAKTLVLSIGATW